MAPLTATHWVEAAQAKDEARDRWLCGQGVTVLRIPASDAYRDLSGVSDAIFLQADALIAVERGRRRLAPSTIGSSADGPPPPLCR